MTLTTEALRLSPDERREQILRVATSHFSRSGYEAVSVRAIAADAGVTRALIYHYFPGKEAILEAVLRQEAKKLLADTAPDPKLTPRENLQRALDIYLNHFSASSGELRELYAPPPAGPSLLQQLAEDNNRVHVERVVGYLGQKMNPTLEVAVKSWLAFVGEAARGSHGGRLVPRKKIIRLCLDALRAVTGSKSI